VNARSLWRISVATSLEAEDAVADILARGFRQPAASYTNAETSRTEVAVFVEDSDPRHPRHPISAKLRARLRAGLARIKACGLNIGSGRITAARLRRQDWAESWKRHFRPIAVGSTLLIKPSWSRRKPKHGQSVVTLDPGLSFGTGQHPTTAFCLRQLVIRRRNGQRQSVLDIGTGSGILAIAAATLGYSPVDAFDLDPEAVRVARANASKNRIARKIRFSRQDLQQLSSRHTKRYSVVCANLIADLLLIERERLLACLQPDGVLIVAGILKEEFRSIQRCYERAGLRLLATRAEAEWRSGAFSQIS
jgi:ribosomal protein L11 methyltransferase